MAESEDRASHNEAERVEDTSVTAAGDGASLSDAGNAAPASSGVSDDAPRPRKVYESSLLPDRRRRRFSPWVVVPTLLIVLGAALYIVFAGKRHRAVATAGEIAYAAAAPGKNSQIWLLPASGTPRAVSPADADADSPAFSDDGNQIAYIETRSGVRQVFVMDGDGTEPVQITSAGSSKSAPQFMPSDVNIVGYLSGGVLYTTRTDTSETDRIFPPPPKDIHGQGKDNANEQEQLTTTTGPTVMHYAFAFSADRNRQPVAAVEEDNGVQLMAFLPTLGSQAIVTENNDPKGHPIFSAPVVTFGWAPDGTHLIAAALGLKSQANMGLSVLVPFDITGSTAGHPVAQNFNGPVGFEQPVYSPDGNLIAVTVWYEPDPANRKCLGLAIVPADASSAPRPLFKGDAEDVQFSADGQSLYFLSLRQDGGHDLYKAALDGSPPTRISDGTVDVTSFTVSRQTASAK